MGGIYIKNGSFHTFDLNNMVDKTHSTILNRNMRKYIPNDDES